MEQDARDPEQVRVGATIKALREAYGLSTEELGKAIEKSARLIRYLESGEKPVSTVLCRKIADQLGVPLAAITMADYAEIREPPTRRAQRVTADSAA
jgi:transcriptional regulator with XRE-family HTH domain